MLPRPCSVLGFRHSPHCLGSWREDHLICTSWSPAPSILPLGSLGPRGPGSERWAVHSATGCARQETCFVPGRTERMQPPAGGLLLAHTSVSCFIKRPLLSCEPTRPEVGQVLCALSFLGVESWMLTAFTSNPPFSVDSVSHAGHVRKTLGDSRQMPSFHLETP